MEPCLRLNIPVESMVRKLILTCNQEYQPILRDQAFSLFRLLCEMGFDFYRVLQLYAKLERFSEEEIRMILQMSPQPKAVLRPTSKDIRMAMPRWTPTKYHTGPIDEVVKEIQITMAEKKQGVHAYNSNLNPKNRRSLNDLYLMIIDGDDIWWYDINRRSTYQFIIE